MSQLLSSIKSATRAVELIGYREDSAFVPAGEREVCLVAISDRLNELAKFKVLPFREKRRLTSIKKLFGCAYTRTAVQTNPDYCAAPTGGDLSE